MKRLITLALCASLAACTQQSANTVGTRAVIAADGGYQAASKAGEDAVLLGKLDKATFKDLDARAYRALLALRVAQAGGSSGDIAAATAALSVAVGLLYTAVAPKGQ